MSTHTENVTLIQMNQNKEEWIDLHTLIQCSTNENGKMVIHYQFDVQKEYAYDTNWYCLRVALRKVGHKIEKYVDYYEDFNLIKRSFYTSITEEEHEYSSKLYNEMVSMGQEIHYE